MEKTAMQKLVKQFDSIIEDARLRGATSHFINAFLIAKKRAKGEIPEERQQMEDAIIWAVGYALNAYEKGVVEQSQDVINKYFTEKYGK